MKSRTSLAVVAAVSALTVARAQTPVTTQVAVAATAATPASVSAVSVAANAVAPVTVATPVSRADAATHVANLSARAWVSSDRPLLLGFAIRGEQSRQVLLRAVGPMLAVSFGLPQALARPRLLLFDADGALLGENSGWAVTPQNVAAVGAAMMRTGAFPFSANSGRDAAMVVTLPPGNYSLQVLDADDAGGVALAEIYDADDSAGGSRLVNVSARSTVSGEGGEMICGLVVAGTSSRQFLIRGIGPALAGFGVTTALSNPKLTVFNAGGVVISTNTRWGTGGSTITATAGTATGINAQPVITVATPTLPLDPAAIAAAVSSTVSVGSATSVIAVAGAASSGVSTVSGAASVALSAEQVQLAAAATATGAFALVPGSADSAVLLTLGPGAYTMQVSSVNSATGAALIEIYELP